MTEGYEWAGGVGETWAAEWRATDRTFVGVNQALVDAAGDRLAGAGAPRILDIGCGAGTTSLSLAETIASATILGVDISPALVTVARERAVAAPSCRFLVGDAARWDAEGDFDLIVSRHGVMFFDDPVAAFAAIRSRARPGGSLLFSCFRPIVDNPWSWILAPAPPPPSDAPGPFAFADEARVAGLLADAGWKHAQADALDVEFVVGEGPNAVQQARTYFSCVGPTAAALRRAEPGAQAGLREAIDRGIEKAHRADRVAFPAAVWIWHAQA
jgi:SAM-dependent methyltransferase